MPTLTELAEDTILEVNIDGQPKSDTWSFNDESTDSSPFDSDEVVCDVCDREFKSPGGLKRHRTVTHGLREAKPEQAPKLGKRSGANKLQKDLEATLQGIAMIVTMINQNDGAAINYAATPMSVAWSNLAQKNAAVDKFLRGLTTGSVYGEVIIATAMMVMPILANHNMLPQSVIMGMGSFAAQAAAQG